MTTLESFLDFMDRGGFVLWPLLLLSIVTVSLVIERAWFWWRLDSRHGRAEYDRLVTVLRTGDAASLRKAAASDRGPYAEFVRLLAVRDHPDESDAAIVAEEVRPRLERGSILLATVVTAAPMLGILGTVVGIIQSFELLGGDATITDPSQVSGGIAEALISTACGLVVALIALFPLMILRGRQDRAVGRLEALASATISASRR
ncbi:MAG: MotA/TolQ/ExbB proton channel family protein [Planctomycetota bacterium]|nr:MotA/TolQ/ExbB proton channel family protein [Planctomycetota bacterium]